MIDLIKPNSTALLRRAVAMAIVLGVLLFPATCSHAAGPHSLFIDPRQSASSGKHDHAHHPASHAGQLSADQTAGPGSASGPADSLTWTDLPSTMGMSLAASTMLLSIPQMLAIPTAQVSQSLQGVQILRGTAVPVEVPPPRAGV